MGHLHVRLWMSQTWEAGAGARQSRSSGIPEAIGTWLPLWGLKPTLSHHGLGSSRDIRSSPRLHPGALPAPWTLQSLVLDFGLFQTFGGGRVRRSQGRGPELVPLPAPSALGTPSPCASGVPRCERPQGWGAPIPPSALCRAGRLRPERSSVPWEEPGRDGGASSGSFVGC